MSAFYQRFRLTEKPDPSILTDEIRQRACIGRTHWNLTFEGLPERPYKRQLLEYIKEMHNHETEGYGIVILGPVGRGKTGLGCIVLRNALARGGRALFMQSSEIIDRLTSKDPGTLPNGAPLLEGLHNVNYLLIDDFEIEPQFWRMRHLQSVIRHRYNDQLPTIITTNIKKEKLFGESWLKTILFDRFDHFILTEDDPDLRKRNRKR